jgi:hypothetical protein
VLRPQAHQQRLGAEYLVGRSFRGGDQGGNGNPAAIPAFIRADFASATRDVLYGMCVIMAIAALVALRGLKRGVQQDTQASRIEDEGEYPGDESDADEYPTFR